MAHADGLQTTNSSESPGAPHGDAIEGSRRSGLPRSDPIGCNERLRPSEVSVVESNGLPDSKKSSGTNGLLSPLEKQRPPPKNASSDESRRQREADELWDVLKAETGYSSYADYLEAYRSRHPLPGHLLNSFARAHRRGTRGLKFCKFTILDLSSDENSRLRVVPRCESDSSISIVMSLRQPPANVAVQVLLWNTNGALDEHKVNALGLGLKIKPPFLKTLLGWRTLQLNPRHVRIGEAVATVVRHYMPDKLDAVPIVLIARRQWDESFANAIEEEIGDIFPFQYSATGKDPPYTPQHGRGSNATAHETGEEEHTKYSGLLELSLEKEEDKVVDVEGLVLKPLFPLLYLNMSKIRAYCEDIRDLNSMLLEENAWCEGLGAKDFTSILAGKIPRLREMIGNLEDDLSRLPRYIRSEISDDWVSNKSWLKVEDDLKRAHQEAGRLEAQIRDCVQLQVGDWALQESKKSIDLSNRQIEEGKRVKIFTVLAFVYVPLNLATSIFGMNLSELNGSGKNLWVFIITATIALLTTGALWFVLEEVNNYPRWRNKSHDGREQFTLGPRIGILVWLLKHGYTSWMWKCGAWWRILINSDSRVMNPRHYRGLSIPTASFELSSGLTLFTSGLE